MVGGEGLGATCEGAAAPWDSSTLLASGMFATGLGVFSP